MSQTRHPHNKFTEVIAVARRVPARRVLDGEFEGLGESRAFQNRTPSVGLLGVVTVAIDPRNRGSLEVDLPIEEGGEDFVEPLARLAKSIEEGSGLDLG